MNTNSTRTGSFVTLLSDIKHAQARIAQINRPWISRTTSR